MNETTPVTHLATVMKVFPHKTAVPSEDRAESNPSNSFDAQFLEYWERIYGHLLRLLGDPADAEDQALETFLRLFQQPPMQGEGYNLVGWLYRVATNLGLQVIRSRKRREHYETTAGMRLLEESRENQPAEIHAADEERQLARQVLSQMNPRQAYLLVLRYSGFSYQEIADQLSLSPTSIGPLLVRAEREFEKRYRKLTREVV